MKSSIHNLIERSAILLALVLNYEGIQIPRLAFIKTWKEHVEFLKSRELKITQNEEILKLDTPISFNLYQSIPPEIRKEVEEILSKLIDKREILESTSIEHSIYRPTKIESSANSNTCINCANAPCMSYEENSSSATEAYPARVCPSNLITFNDKGFLQINFDDCTGCLLCINRCPINALSLNKIVQLKQYNSDDIGKIVKLEHISSEKKDEVTKDLLSQFGKSEKKFVIPSDVKSILDNFDKRISRMELNWDRDPYYIWVRNIFRELGLNAIYTGGGGKLKRSDITIIEPFFVGMEVKSPAEGPISVGAIRQAITAKVEVTNTYRTKEAYCAVIAQDTSRGVHANAVDVSNAFKIKIPLIQGRFLLYILLKHITSFPQDAKYDIKRLFTDFNGEFGKKELISYFEEYFRLRIRQIENNTHALSSPKILGVTSKDGINELQRMFANVKSEIENCFPDPEREARGSYKVIR